MTLSSPWWQLLKPRNWLWLPILLLLAAVVQLPYRWQYHLGLRLGRLLRHIDRKGVHTTRVNSHLAFPELTEAEREAFIQSNYESVGLSLIETATAWLSRQARYQHLLTFDGLEHWLDAQATGRGVILVSAHLGCLEIVGRLLAARHPLGVMYRPQKLAILDAFTRYYRHKYYQQIIARDDLRGLIRALKKGHTIWYTPDIDAGLRNSVFVPFFGIATATLTTTSRLAAKTGAIVIPTFFYRQAAGSGYTLVFQPPIDHFPSGDDLADATRLNAIIEAAIRKAPTQYLWQYKRFKTRPVGEKRFY